MLHTAKVASVCFLTWISSKLVVIAVKVTNEQSCEQTNSTSLQGGLNKLKIGLGHENYALITSVGIQCNFYTGFLIILFNVYN